METIYNIEVFEPNGEWDVLIKDVPYSSIAFEVKDIVKYLGYRLNEIRIVGLLQEG